MNNTPRLAYIARYRSNAENNDLQEEILFRDTYWSPELSKEWERLTVSPRATGEPMLQAWYADRYSTVCMGKN